VKRVLLTGASRGLGAGLLREARATGADATVIGRHPPDAGSTSAGSGTEPALRFIACDLATLDSIPRAVDEAIDGVDVFDLVLLNAGVLGEIRDLSEQSINDVRGVMDVNVWANKVLLDRLLDPQHGAAVRHVVGISSGAAANGSGGWGPYAISKAALNLLLRVYADERPATHFTALAPGVIRTAMTESIVADAPRETRHPASGRIRELFEHGEPSTPAQAARRIFSVLSRLRSEFPSGAFVDVRDLE